VIRVTGAVNNGMAEMFTWQGGYNSPEDLRRLRPYIAMGFGDINWDASSPSDVLGTETTLTSEICRVVPYLYHTLDTVEFDRGKLLDDPSNADIIRFVGEFRGKEILPETSPGSYVREVGLFIQATEEKNSGQLVLLVRHGRVWWDPKFSWRRELIVDMRALMEESI